MGHFTSRNKKGHGQHKHVTNQGDTWHWSVTAQHTRTGSACNQLHLRKGDRRYQGLGTSYPHCQETARSSPVYRVHLSMEERSLPTVTNFKVFLWVNSPEPLHFRDVLTSKHRLVPPAQFLVGHAMQEILGMHLRGRNFLTKLSFLGFLKNH